MDVLDLARWQFGITTVYHFLFVPLTIGLGIFVACLQTAWHRTGKDHYLRLTKFFGKLFLINFAMGVVTGLVQEFQFGMNWSEYSIFVGDVFGAPLAMEALLAFFLESTFLGLWIFGWDKLPKRVHLATIWAAAIGSNLSAYFILAANAWMKHPVGYVVENGKARMTDIWAVLTNSTALVQVPHVVSGSFVVAGGFILAVIGYRIMRERRKDPTGPDAAMWRSSLRGALVMTAIAGVIVAVSGDFSAKLLHEQQPMKLAAAEGLERDTQGAGFSPVPGVEIPGMLSFLATYDTNSTISGVEDLQERFEQEFGPGDYRPNMPVIYWSFRVMIVFGLATVGLSLIGLWLTRKRARSKEQVPFWFARVLFWSLPLPLLAVIAGWLLAEMGRQPWVVQGELLTAASVSPGVTFAEVAISLTVFTLLYGALAVAEGILLARYIRKGPEPIPVETPAADKTDDNARQLTFMY
ncbi:cytochrome ubiquinol oxidase subunit I [Sinosporangium siamense]|uniref:Cytochrome ubiquinol oxidase subunit I n=1 Tax=Sinosporangium siamense TaxID=1367973 RepID=A0A919V7I0_9ACTN|nr:cytochrome ubiquinol oxidase subunit I [Sinosporangium siamense]GII92102.1 cytochrome ubiquinol oxidase subunit I [Sinosporangium siamense]